MLSRSLSVSIPQAVWIACNVHMVGVAPERRTVSIPQAVLIACNCVPSVEKRKRTTSSVSIPQAVWIACNGVEEIIDENEERFQYRKRYGLHAMVNATAFGTPSGFQYRKRYGLHAILKGDLTMKKKAQFQYRKRYGLHAIAGGSSQLREFPRFNTASGMDCMQYSSVDVMAPIPGVSIPQAVWIACN